MPSNLYGVRGATRGIWGGLQLHIGPNQADRRHELMLARIAAGTSPNRTPSAEHLAHLRRTGGAGGGGGGGPGTGSPSPSGVLDSDGAVQSMSGDPQAIQGLNIPAGALPQLLANTPPPQNPNERKMMESELANFLRRGG